MKKTILTILLLSSNLLPLSAQSWLWARQGRNTGKQEWLTGATSIAMDKYHNVYQTGKYDGDTIIFSMDTLIGLPYETFLVKYDENGNVLWAKSSRTNQNNSNHIIVSEYVTTDSKGNAYITGEFEDTLNFQSFSLECPTKNFSHAFLVKYDADGNVKWAKQSKTMDTEFAAAIGFSIATDKSDNIYVTGDYQSSAYFGADTLKGTFYPNAFLIKYDSTGNVIWATQGINSVNGAATGRAVITDNLGYVYVTGEFGDSITFGAQTLTNPSLIQNNLFIVKYDSNGNVVWATQPTLLKGLSGSTGYALGKDVSNNIYITGYFYDTVTFGATTLINPYIPSRGCSGIFWAKYAPNESLIYAKEAFVLDSLQWEGWSITTDDKYNIYLTGEGGGLGTQKAKIIFNSDTLQSKVKDGSVWLKFDSNGKSLNSYIFPTGGDSPQTPTVIDSSGCYVYFGGTTFDTIMVLGADTVGTNYEAFRPIVARWSDEECATGINTIENQQITVNLYPNPTTNFLTINFNRQIIGPATLSIMDITGRKILNEQLTIDNEQLTMDISSLATGMYFVSVNTNQTIITKKFIKL